MAGPSGLNVGGFVTRRPGVYAEVDASALNSASVSTNNIAILGDFPFLQGPGDDSLSNPLQNAAPARVASANGFKKLALGNSTIQTLLPLIYNPANDPQVSGQPQTVTLVNVTPNSQASAKLTNGATSLITLKAKAWGPSGNLTTVSVSGDPGDKTVTVSKSGATETFTKLGNDDDSKLFEVSYNGDDDDALDAVTLALDSGILSLESKNTNAITAGTAGTILIRLHEGEFAQIGNTFDLVFTLGGETQTFSIDKEGSAEDTYTAILNALNVSTSPVVATAVADPSGSSAGNVVQATSKFAGTGTVNVACSDGRIIFHPTGDVTTDNISITNKDFAGGTNFGPASVTSTTVTPQSGKVSVVIVSSAYAHGQGVTGMSGVASYSVTFSGTSLGIAASETITSGTLSDANTKLTFTSTKNFDGVVSVAISEGSTNLYASGSAADIAYNWSHAEVNYASDIVNLINDFDDEGDGKGFSATLLSPQASGVAAGNLDKIAVAASIKDTSVAVYSRTWQIFNELKKSALITPELSASIATSGGGDIDTLGKTFLSGGAVAASTDTHWEKALNVMRDPKHAVEIFVPLSSSLSVHKKVRAHCDYMAGLGRHECLAWCGAPSKATVGTVSTADSLAKHTAQINSRFVALAFQDIYVADSAGNTQWLTPEYTAVLLASMQASTPVATPLTRKVPNVLDVRQAASITLMDDVETLLKKCLVTIMPTAAGWWVERSVTTYQLTNMVYNEMSANESVNTSIRDLRAYLTGKIGSGNVAATKTVLENIVNMRLISQVQEEIIKAFDPSSIVVTDLGDTYNIAYTAAPVFPLNFIKLEATFVAVI